MSRKFTNGMGAVKKSLLFISITLIISGCSSDSSLIEDVVKKYAYDPDSLKFRSLLINKYGSKACIEVQGKNRMGGYSGWRFVSLVNRDSEWFIKNDNEKSVECNKEILDIDPKEQFKELEAIIYKQKK